VIVAVTAVRVMKVPTDDVVGVIAMSDRFVTAASAVLVRLVVLAAVV
jgi:hypothetical protein